MLRKNKWNAKRFAVGTGLAAVAGYLAGILTAPKSGKQTRRAIKTDAKKGVKLAEEEVKNIHSELDMAVDDLKSRGSKAGKLTAKEVSELVDKAKTGKAKTQEVLTAFKKGEAKDEDLNKAVIQAKRAVKNISKYIKK